MTKSNAVLYPVSEGQTWLGFIHHNQTADKLQSPATAPPRGTWRGIRADKSDKKARGEGGLPTRPREMSASEVSVHLCRVTVTAYKTGEFYIKKRPFNYIKDIIF